MTDPISTGLLLFLAVMTVLFPVFGLLAAIYMVLTGHFMAAAVLMILLVLFGGE